MKPFLIVLVIVLCAGLFGYSYVTRPVPAPSTVSPSTENSATSGEAQIIPRSKVSGDEEIRSVFMAINANESKAEFKLKEVLRGKPTIVIGSTNILASDVGITFAPANIMVSDVKINARGLKTDSSQRDGAISRLILHSDKSENEFITFKNIKVTGLPTEIPKNTKFNMVATGDLTINGITKKTSFSGSGTINDKNVFSGELGTVITHTDFDLKIPDLSFLANVDKESKINIYFVAK